MTDPTWVSLLPPLLAIVLAVWSRQVYLSLAAGIWLGWTILEAWHPLRGLATAIEQAVAILGDAGSAKVILFTLVIGALIATIEASGGVRGFVRWLEEKKWVTTARGAQWLAWTVGLIIFIESNITVLVSGAVARPLFDRFRASREKLAYLIDSTSAPVCILIPLNAWGAYVLGLLQGLGVERPLDVFLPAILLNFYAIAAVAVAAASIAWRLDFGPMARAEARTQGGQLLWPNANPLMDIGAIAPNPGTHVAPRAVNMVVPIAVMVLSMPAAMFITGHGDLRAGSGSTSVLWAVLAGLAAAWLLLLVQRAYSVDDLMRIALRGAGGLVGLALIMLLAFSLGAVARELGTGLYVARVTVGVLPPAVYVPLIFLVSAGIAFATGTSWGTFAIMLPIAVPAAQALGLPLAPFVAAVLSGGVFGDHSSPISDTTIISSMAAATDHIDHVRTQLPYALLAAGLATAGFLLVGLAL